MGNILICCLFLLWKPYSNQNIKFCILDMRQGEKERGDSTYQYLMLEGAQEQQTYQNSFGLAIRLLVLCFSSLYFGYCLTYLSTFSKTTATTVYGQQAGKSSVFGLLIGVLPLGAIAGAGTAPLLMRVLSRKQFILVVNLGALIIEGILQIPNIYVLLGCRIFQGIFTGYYMSIIPIYINQLSPNQIVGSFGVFTQLFALLGVILSYALGLILTALNAEPYVFYRIMVLFNVIFIIIQSILLIVGYIPQSPNSLIKKNRNQEAKEVIAMFTIARFVQKVFNQKKMQVEVQLNVGGGDKQEQTKIKYSFKAYLLGFQLPFMQQMTGINAIVTQANNIVSKSIPAIAPYVSIIINGFQLLATICTIVILKKVGRRPLTLFGNLGLAIVDIAIGILFVFSDWSPSGIFIFVLLIVYMIIYGISIGPSVWLYVPEIIPAKVVPLATMTNWFGASVCVIFTPMAIEANDDNAFPVFFFYGGLTMIFFIINVFLMVETKDLTSEQIAKKFNKQA